MPPFSSSSSSPLNVLLLVLFLLSVLVVITSYAFDPYKSLELPRTATAEEIRKAYKTLALKYHPDRHKSQDQSDRDRTEQKFIEISKAYDILKDEEKRKQYDLFGSTEDGDIEDQGGDGDAFPRGRDREGGFRSFFDPDTGTHHFTFFSHQSGEPGNGHAHPDMNFDPFDLFREIFGEGQDLFGDSSHDHHYHHHNHGEHHDHHHHHQHFHDHHGHPDDHYHRESAFPDVEMLFPSLSLQDYQALIKHKHWPQSHHTNIIFLDTNTMGCGECQSLYNMVFHAAQKMQQLSLLRMVHFSSVVIDHMSWLPPGVNSVPSVICIASNGDLVHYTIPHYTVEDLVAYAHNCALHGASHTIRYTRHLPEIQPGAVHMIYSQEDADTFVRTLPFYTSAANIQSPRSRQFIRMINAEMAAVIFSSKPLPTPVEHMLAHHFRYFIRFGHAYVSGDNHWALRVSKLSSTRKLPAMAISYDDVQKDGDTHTALATSSWFVSLDKETLLDLFLEQTVHFKLPVLRTKEQLTDYCSSAIDCIIYSHPAIDKAISQGDTKGIDPNEMERSMRHMKTLRRLADEGADLLIDDSGIPMMQTRYAIIHNFGKWRKYLNRLFKAKLIPSSHLLLRFKGSGEHVGIYPRATISDKYVRGWLEQAASEYYRIKMEDLPAPSGSGDGFFETIFDFFRDLL